MNKEPLKTSVLRAFASGEALGAAGVHALLQAQYPGERYCSLAVVADHLKSLRAVGLLLEDESFVDDAGRLVSLYKISECGLAKLPRNRP
jgi:hypothetical protein